MKKTLTFLTTCVASFLFAGECLLTQMDLSQYNQGWGKPQINKTVEGRAMQIGGVPFATGLGSHAPAMFSFVTGVGQTTFSADIGLDDVTLPNCGEAAFIVRAGGKEIYNSGKMRTGDKAKSIRLELPQKTLVTLEINSLGANSCDHSNWCNAKFTYSDEAPKTRFDNLPNKVNVADYGIRPGADALSNSALLSLLCEALSREKRFFGRTLYFPKGQYHFYSQDAMVRTWYISNHDQWNPKRVAFALEDLDGFTLDGDGSDFIFHGRMMPFGLIRCKNVTLKDFDVDFHQPQITQLNITGTDAQKRETSFTLEPGVQYFLRGTRLTFGYKGWENAPGFGLFFDANRHMTPGMCDEGFNLGNVVETTPGHFTARGVYDQRVKPGTRVAMRGWDRPCPGIFVTECVDTTLKNVAIHYSEGMALIAQLSENITLKGFRVALRGDKDPRYFTTQADATHFSGCKGLIRSEDGLYENMMDDAINVHGTYLKVIKRIDDYTLQCRYMHGQAWGFKWGDPGDDVQFVKSTTMEILGEPNKVASIKPFDKPTVEGCRVFEIRFEKPLGTEINANIACGVENLTWTPEVIFRNNVVRNNRARGVLFSTPRRVVCEDNVFDHVSGCAILLCGDCNGWYETGACREVIIRNNTFINCLASIYQFCEAVISICPEIPGEGLHAQKKYFHSGIVIEDNVFKSSKRADGATTPLLFAKSVDGITFKDNKLEFIEGPNSPKISKKLFRFMRVKNAMIEDNEFPIKPEDFNLFDSPMPTIK